MAATAPGVAGGSYQKYMAEALKRFSRSIELCDDYLRGYYGLKLVRPLWHESWDATDPLPRFHRSFSMMERSRRNNPTTTSSPSQIPRPSSDSTSWPQLSLPRLSGIALRMNGGGVATTRPPLQPPGSCSQKMHLRQRSDGPWSRSRGPLMAAPPRSPATRLQCPEYHESGRYCRDESRVARVHRHAPRFPASQEPVTARRWVAFIGALRSHVH